MKSAAIGSPARTASWSASRKFHQLAVGSIAGVVALVGSVVTAPIVMAQPKVKECGEGRPSYFGSYQGTMTSPKVKRDVFLHFWEGKRPGAVDNGYWVETQIQSGPDKIIVDYAGYALAQSPWSVEFGLTVKLGTDATDVHPFYVDPTKKDSVFEYQFGKGGSGRVALPIKAIAWDCESGSSVPKLLREVASKKGYVYDLELKRI
ncbi:hypothetical protein ACIA8C_17840 [Nocardia sp. NPDC051321]|uniref:hypothetical protein n=1 Tax=Nocardia sp. NPDC051321 TaxID=3364323 RepID=UPI0037A88E24